MIAIIILPHSSLFRKAFLERRETFLQTVGIVCEYNPLHLGHLRQLDAARTRVGPGGAIVCLMSGDYVQRGTPAIFPKALRARGAVLCGADLVLELPVTASLSSAEGFAARSVEILVPFCGALCFGAENPEPAALRRAAEALLGPEFPPLLRENLARGVSFPAARQAALAALGVDPALAAKPNNILAVEYCKAILSQNAAMDIFPLSRPAGVMGDLPDPENPSAAAIRAQIEGDKPFLDYVPEPVRSLFAAAPVHTLAAGERAVLARLRSMEEAEFASLPYGSEGLWRKLYKAVRREPTLEAVFAAVKSKRYPRTRLQRMVLCAALGLTARTLSAPAPYVRVLALNEKGGELLKIARKTGAFPNAGAKLDSPYQVLERRAEDLYGLFAREEVGPPGNRSRVQFLEKTLDNPPSI